MPIASLPAIAVNHVQQEPAATWRVEHNQHGYPVVDVYTATESGAIQKIIPMGIEYVNDNTVNILFSQPVTGFATVVI